MNRLRSSVTFDRKSRGPFWAGTKFAASVVGMLTAAIGMFNIAIDWFDWDISPLLKPLIDLYKEYIPGLFRWIDIRVDWMVPNWPPDVITIAITLSVLMARALLAYSERDSSDLIPVKIDDGGFRRTVYVERRSGFLYQTGLIAIQLSVVFASICVPYLRYPITAAISVWSLVALKKAFRGPSVPDFLTVYGYGHRRQIFAGRYMWGCIASAALLLLINAYQ